GPRPARGSRGGHGRRTSLEVQVGIFAGERACDQPAEARSQGRIEPPTDLEELIVPGITPAMASLTWQQAGPSTGLELSKLVIPSSSLLDGLGRGRRVQAKAPRRGAVREPGQAGPR